MSGRDWVRVSPEVIPPPVNLAAEIIASPPGPVPNTCERTRNQRIEKEYLILTDRTRTQNRRTFHRSCMSDVGDSRYQNGVPLPRVAVHNNSNVASVGELLERFVKVNFNTFTSTMGERSLSKHEWVCVA